MVINAFKKHKGKFETKYCIIASGGGLVIEIIANQRLVHCFQRETAVRTNVLDVRGTLLGDRQGLNGPPIMIERSTT